MVVGGEDGVEVAGAEVGLGCWRVSMIQAVCGNNVPELMDLFALAFST